MQEISKFYPEHEFNIVVLSVVMLAKQGTYCVKQIEKFNVLNILISGIWKKKIIDGKTGPGNGSFCSLTHCDLMTPYGYTDLGQRWLR